MRATHAARRRCAQNADHLALDCPILAFFAEVVCTLGATPPRTVTSPPANGGNCTNRGATRRRHADRMLLMVQNPPPLPLASRSLTGVILPHQCMAARRAPINAGRAPPTRPCCTGAGRAGADKRRSGVADRNGAGTRSNHVRADTGATNTMSLSLPSGASVASCSAATAWNTCQLSTVSILRQSPTESAAHVPFDRQPGVARARNALD